jgi:transcriptional regulator with XRE-family HTH domain
MKYFNCNTFFDRVSELFGSTSQQELSKKIGISQAVISSIKTRSSKSPSADTIFLIANHFNVSTDWLLGLTDTKSTDKATKEQIFTEGYNAGYNALKERILHFAEGI